MMSEIADLTYNVGPFTEIMQMIWKRLNDHGKNWRHVYKALVLLEYLIKTGSEKVAQQCKENIFAIQTLKDFQYLDDNKDQGINVREKAKSLVALLKDDERLRNERVRALKAKERFAQSAVGIGSDTVNRDPDADQSQVQPPAMQVDVLAATASEIDAARPHTAGEEELQLQLALAISREDAEQEETGSKSDDMRLQLALQKSKEVSKDDQVLASQNEPKKNSNSRPSTDLLDLDFGSPVAQPPPPERTVASSGADPWGMPVQQQQQQLDPWGATASAASDPWSPVKEPPRTSPQPNLVAAPNNAMVSNDPWSTFGGEQGDSSNVLGGTGNDVPWGFPAAAVAPTIPAASNNIITDPFSPMAQKELTDFDLLRNEIEAVQPNNGNGGTTSSNPFDLSGLGATMQPLTANNLQSGAKPKQKSMNSLLGEHSNLVNLDNLVTDAKNPTQNPFENTPPNPFQAVKVQKPAMNQLLQQQSTPWQQPAAPTSQQQGFNPFS
jgi:epsin